MSFMSSELRLRLAALIRTARQEEGLTQRQLAAEAGVSQSAVGAVERGHGGTLEIIERIAHALDAVPVLVLRGRPVLGRPDPSDAAHSLTVATMRRLFARAGLATATEQPVSDGRVRGWIDLLAFDEQAGRLIVDETKSSLADMGALERQVELYARLALQPARALGWHPHEILVVVTVLATAEADAFVSAHRAELATEFPVRGREAVRALLDRGPIRGRALVAVDPTRPGRQALTSFHADGRKRAFSFETPRDVVAAHAARTSNGRHPHPAPTRPARARPAPPPRRPGNRS